MKNNYLILSLILICPLILAHDDNVGPAAFIALLNKGFNQPTNSNVIESLKEQLPSTSTQFEHEVLLPHTITRSFGIEELATIAEKTFGWTHLDFFSDQYSVWDNDKSRLLLKDTKGLAMFDSRRKPAYCETEDALWIASSSNNNAANLMVLSKRDDTLSRLNLQYAHLNSLHYDSITKAFYVVCNPSHMNRRLYKFSVTVPYNKELIHEFINSSDEYSDCEAYHLLADQIFLINRKSSTHCEIIDVTNGLSLSTIRKKSNDINTRLSTSKNMVALIGDKIEYISERFSVILYNLTNLQQPTKAKHLKFNKPILDAQFIPGHDDKIIIVTNEPFSERIRLYDCTHDSYLDIHTDFIRNVRITSDALYFYNFKDKKGTNRDKKALYTVDYKSLYMYQHLKTLNQSPVETVLHLSRASELEAPEQN